MSRICVGVDFGGTSIKFGALDEQYQATEIFDLPTPAQDGPDAIIAQICRGVEKLLTDQNIDRGDVVGVGIGSPGPLSIKRGILLNLPNVPNMQNVPMRDAVSERVGLPVTLENDANAAAYAEFIVGAGRDTHDMVMLTLGTGLGSGIVHEGDIIHGAHEIGGEVGHLIVHPGGRLCACGQRGCAEQYCSAINLAKHTAERIRNGNEPTSLRDVLEREGQLTAKDIVEARNSGDDLAAEAWDECCYYLAITVVNLCRLFDPDRIVLAGGLTNAGDDLLQPLRRHATEQNWHMFEEKTDICIATVGAAAGAIGAAGVAWHEFGKDEA